MINDKIFQMLEVRDMELPFPEANTVVRCCLYYQLKMRSGLLLLFTNDPWMSYLATNNRLHTLNGKVRLLCVCVCFFYI